jgi:hypothetical protein
LNEKAKLDWPALITALIDHIVGVPQTLEVEAQQRSSRRTARATLWMLSQLS